MNAVLYIVSKIRQWLPKAWQMVTAAWGLLVRGVKALWSSFASLIRSPAVWLACGAVFVGGFVAGYGGPAHKLEAVLAEKQTLANSLKAVRLREATLAAKAEKAEKEAAEAKAELSALMERVKPKTPPAAKPAPAKRIQARG